VALPPLPPPATKVADVKEWSEWIKNGMIERVSPALLGLLLRRRLRFSRRLEDRLTSDWRWHCWLWWFS